MDNNYYALIYEYTIIPHFATDTNLTIIYGDSPSNILKKIKDVCYPDLDEMIEDLGSDEELNNINEFNEYLKYAEEGSLTLEQLKEFSFELGASVLETVYVEQGKKGLIKILECVIKYCKEDIFDDIDNDNNPFGDGTLINKDYCKDILKKINNNEDYIQELEDINFKINKY